MFIVLPSFQSHYIQIFYLIFCINPNHRILHTVAHFSDSYTKLSRTSNPCPLPVCCYLLSTRKCYMGRLKEERGQWSLRFVREKLKLRVACSSLDLSIPSPVLLLSSQHPEKTDSAHRMELTTFREMQKNGRLQFTLPGVFSRFLHLLVSVVPLKVHVSSSREPSLTASPLAAPGAAFHCCLNSQCLFLSLSLTTAAATRQGLPWSQTLS